MNGTLRQRLRAAIREIALEALDLPGVAVVSSAPLDRSLHREVVDGVRFSTWYNPSLQAWMAQRFRSDVFWSSRVSREEVRERLLTSDEFAEAFLRHRRRIAKLERRWARIKEDTDA